MTSDPTASPEVSPASSENSNYVMRTGMDLWMHRFAVLLFVLLCAATGVTLAILPWSLQWSDNYLLLRFPALQPIVTNGFVRGVCTGLGLLDLWIGFAEAVHYHEEKPAQK
ncbi:MAG TPA: hypothetical protein VLK33_04150 [Terriglobales bacterium]|nr:hypothetical protein [Terriglobales bacterium]